MKYVHRVFGLFPLVLLATLGIALPSDAEHREVDIRLRVNRDETYAILVRKAESLARNATQQAFDQEVFVSSVSVKVTAQSADRAAIILKLQTNRENWQNRPDPRLWSLYFPMAKSLMGIN
jgi:hypothetical protein